MGYYSEVGLVLTANGSDKLTLALASTKDDTTRRELEDLLRYADQRIAAPLGEHAWYWNGIKWYSEFREITWLESLLQTLADEDYYFIRIGEDNDDIVVAGGYWENPFGMELNRSILLCEPKDAAALPAAQ